METRHSTSAISITENIGVLLSDICPSYYLLRLQCLIYITLYRYLIHRLSNLATYLYIS